MVEPTSHRDARLTGRANGRTSGLPAGGGPGRAGRVAAGDAAGITTGTRAGSLAVVIQSPAGAFTVGARDRPGAAASERCPRTGGRRKPVVGSPRGTIVLIAEPGFYVAATVAVLVVGIAKGGLGGGIAVVGVPLMAMVVSPAQAAAVLLPILLVMDALAVRAYRGAWDRRNLRVLVPAALLGTALGALTFGYLSPDGLRALVGVIALAYALQHFAPRAASAGGPPRVAAGVFWGALAGFASFSVHAGGPPLQAHLLPQRMDRTTFQATGVAFFFVVNWSKVGPYAWLGQWSADNLLTSLVLLPLAPLGVWIGRRLHQRADDALFFRIVHVSLFVVGVKLLSDAAA